MEHNLILQNQKYIKHWNKISDRLMHNNSPRKSQVDKSSTQRWSKYNYKTWFMYFKKLQD